MDASALYLRDVALGSGCGGASLGDVGLRHPHLPLGSRVALPRAVVRDTEPRRLGPVDSERSAVRLPLQLEVVPARWRRRPGCEKS